MSARQKIYLIAAFFSIVLLFIAVHQAYPILVNFDDPLGLASWLPAPYWAGLVLIVATSIVAFLDRDLKKDAVFIFILFVLALFLYGAKPFFQENAGDPTVYAPLGDVRTLIAQHSLDIRHPIRSDVQSYYSWPAFHFINAALLDISGASLAFVKYMPLYFALALIFIVYGISKRLKLEARYSFLLTFLALTSWLVAFAGYYYPRIYALILYLLLFMLMVVQEKTVEETFCVIVMFAASVITHGQVSMMLIPGLAVLALWRRDFRYLLLFVGVTIAWYLYLAPDALDIAVDTLGKMFLSLFEITQVERYQAPATDYQLAMRYSRMALLGIYVLLVSAGALLLLFRKVRPEYRKYSFWLFAFTIGVGLTLVLGFGEQTYRTYIFALVPTAGIAVLTVFTIQKRVVVTLAAILMFVFAALFLLANYTNEAAWGQVSTSELRGTEFFATRVNPYRAVVFKTYSAQLFYFFNPDLRNRVGFPYEDRLRTYDIHLPEDVVRPPTLLAYLDRKYTLIDYVSISDLGLPSTPGGVDWRSWPQTEGGKKANLIYNSSHMQIYDNHLLLMK